MVWLATFDEARKNQIRREKHTDEGGVTKTPFLGSRKNPDLPHADLNQHDPGRYSSTHFHIRDQFQVVIAGGGTLGRHELAPYSVHFSRAYTPYGPLIADKESGITFFVMRAHPDNGSQHLPEEQDQLDHAVDRRPWQITRPVAFAQDGAEAGLRPIAGLTDAGGLAGYTLAMKPGTRMLAPESSRGDGQYVVVVEGSLWHGDKEHRALALVFRRPTEERFEVRAGDAGLKALVLNFPVRRTASETKSASALSGLKTARCTLCSFVYSESAGLPDEGIAPGTRWEDVPASWTCPDCSTSKDDFEVTS